MTDRKRQFAFVRKDDDPRQLVIEEVIQRCKVQKMADELRELIHIDDKAKRMAAISSVLAKLNL